MKTLYLDTIIAISVLMLCGFSNLSSSENVVASPTANRSASCVIGDWFTPYISPSTSYHTEPSPTDIGACDLVTVCITTSVGDASDTATVRFYEKPSGGGYNLKWQGVVTYGPSCRVAGLGFYVDEYSELQAVVLNNTGMEMTLQINKG